jgi:serine/threonine-protein kinase
MQYRNTDKNLRRIGQELGVTTIVEGEVLQVGNRVRVNVQLIDAKTDMNLWADQYDRQVADVFEIQSDIAKRIVAALHATLEPDERVAIERRPTDNVEAYGFYLRAIEYRDRSQTEKDRRTALRMLESAIDLDPEFAPAWAELSHLHSLIFWYHWDRSDQRLALAKAAAEKAGELQPGSGEAHVAMGFCHYLGHLDYERALAEFEQALQRLPNDAELWAGVGWIKRRQGRFDEAIFNLMKAFELSPRSARLPYNIADTYRYLRDFAAAERYYERARLLNPGWLGPYWRKAFLYVAWQGDTTKARVELDEWRARSDPSYRDYTIELYWARRYAEALEWLSASPHPIFQLFPDLNEANVPKPLEIAHIYRLMGRTDQALAYYDSARIVSEAELVKRPDAEWVHSALGLAYAGLGRKQDAIREGRIGVELMPLEKEAVWKGQSRLEQLTQIYILVGEYDAAIEELEHLLSIPSWLTVPLLGIDPMYDPLRGHPRFEALLAKYR